MSTETREAPHHDNLTCVKQYRCRRPECLDRERQYNNTRMRLIAYGRWEPYVDAEPVRAHVRMLMSYGIGWQRVCRISGVPNGSISRLLYGDTREGRKPSKRVRTATADKVFAIRPSLDNVADRRAVDGTGTRRRLQALMAVGWPQAHLADHLGVTHTTVYEQINHKVDTATGATARAVRDLYDRLWNVDPTSRGVSQRWADQARAVAARNGWPPPAAWDDDYIDSPAAIADLGDSATRSDALAEDALWLINTQGYDRARAAERLGVKRGTLDTAIARSGLTQQDTEQAA
ncbi:hypothetical protein [Streptomyces phytophilus]|uniref:hypothetical protein n=1 Tax=Streptomyces phytophilus TaxID=722715 RepID=UPI0015F04653|nr:hypothetical protein [Streptomyces phytophilus]